jgi:DNA anti-recombination protein RmuC
LGHECTEEDVEFVQRVQSSKWIQISNELQDEIAGLNRRIAELESKNAKQLKKVRSVERKKFDEQLKTIMKNAEKRNSETNFKNGVFAATTVVGIVILALYCV